MKRERLESKKKNKRAKEKKGAKGGIRATTKGRRIKK